MIPYPKLLYYLNKQHEYPVNTKQRYSVVVVPGSKYHITVFQDQWNDYQNVTGLPFHLFHISSDSEENRCSSYFWVDKNTYRIKKIPGKYFKYNQPAYNFYNSTRNPCHLSDIMPILKKFQRILLKMKARNKRKN